MKCKRACIFLFLFYLTVPAQPSEQPLMEVLKKMSLFHPSVQRLQFLREAAQFSVVSARSRYYPNLDFAAVATQGNPGAFSYLGVNNNFGASQRSGLGGALVLQQTIWDFGRTSSAIEAAEVESKSRSAEAGVELMNSLIHVAEVYLDCAFMRNQIQTSRSILDLVRVIVQETDRFVRSGQRTIVERYLVETELKEVETRVAEYLVRQKALQARLAVMTGAQEITCRSLTNGIVDVKELEAMKTESPLLRVRVIGAELTRIREQEARSKLRPTIQGLITGGYFNSTAVDANWNYSAAIGITIPLFTAGRLDADTARAEAESKAERTRLSEVRLRIDETNIKFDEQILALQVRLNYLNKEKSLAEDFYDIARKRYFSLQGTMTDLRDTIKNLNRVRQSIDEATHKFYSAKVQHSLFNGSVPR